MSKEHKDLVKNGQTSTQKHISWGAPSRLVLFVHFYIFSFKLPDFSSMKMCRESVELAVDNH